jgi:UDP-glucose 4-epimerase
LLGSHLALRLVADGHPTTVFSRSFNPILLESADGHGIRLVEGEVSLSTALEEEVGAADLIFCTAGSSTPSASSLDPVGSLAGSVVPAVAVLELVRRAGKGRAIFASSGGTVYGCPAESPTPERAPLEPISLHGLHAVSMERYVGFFADRHSLDAAILRYSNLYGPGQLARRSQGVVAAWLRAIAAGEPVVLFGDGSVRRDFVYVDDAVSATVLAATNPAAQGAYNVGAGRAHSLKEVLSVIEDVVDDSFAIDAREAREVDVPIIELDYSRIQELTGWAPATELREGVAASWAWLRKRAGGAEAIVEPRGGSLRLR